MIFNIKKIFIADNGTMTFWDYKTGLPFQSLSDIPQPGSLDAEAGIFCSTFDQTGSRLITGCADKTIKVSFVNSKNNKHLTNKKTYLRCIKKFHNYNLIINKSNVFIQKKKNISKINYLI